MRAFTVEIRETNDAVFIGRLADLSASPVRQSVKTMTACVATTDDNVEERCSFLDSLSSSL